MARHPYWAALAGFGLLTGLFYAPLLLGVRTFPDGDFTHHFLPFSRFQLETLRSGQLPVWNPYTYSGHPFLADTQAAVFYPLSNLFLALSWFWTAAATRLYWLQIEAMSQIALAGFFVFLLVNELTRNCWAAFVAGACFAFSGYLTGYPPLQLAILRTAIWLPALLWLLTRGLAAPHQWRWWIASGCAGAIAVSAGHPQTLLYIVYTVTAYTLYLLVGAGKRADQRGRATGLWPRLGGLAAALLITLALGAAQLWPSLAFAAESVRANVDYVFVSGGLPLQDTWQLLLPGVLTQFSPLYIGAVGLALVVVAIGAWAFARPGWTNSGPPELPADHRKGTEMPFFLLLALIGLLLAYGANGFLYPLFYWLAPGWNYFRGQERAALLVALGLSVVAGYGMAAIPCLTLRIRQRLTLVFLAITAAGIYGYGLFWQLFGRSAIGQWHYLSIAGVTLTLVAALAVPLRLPGWSHRRSLFVTALVLANLFWANLATNLDQFGPTRKLILAPEVSALQQAANERATANLGLPGRVYNEFRAYEDYGMIVQVEDVWGSSPLRLARYARLFEEFPLDRMWQLTGVEHVLTWRRELFEASDLLGEFPQASDATYLHRLRERNPRAWLVRRVQPASDDAAVQLLADHTFDLAQTALLPADAITAAQGNAVTTGALISLTRTANNRLQVTVNSVTGGLLVVSENWLPGWRVANATCSSGRGQCEGLESPLAGLTALAVYRADLTLLGVPLPPGQVTFDLLYWPASIRYGLWISGVSALLLVALAGWRWLRRRGGQS